MDNMGTPGPNHPAHKGLKAPDNVVKLPGMHMRRARIFKNNLLDAVIGPEQVEYKDEPEESHLDNYIKTSIENSPQAEGRNNKDFHESRITSIGKFKEDKANRELMNNNE